MPKPDMIGIVCKDLPATVKFYRALGLDIPAGAEQEDHVEYISPNGYRIAWDSENMVKGFDPDFVPPPTGARGRIGIAFKCDSPAEVDAVHQKLVGMGYRSHKAPWDAFWGQRYALVLDPDGNIIDLFAPL